MRRASILRSSRPTHAPSPPVMGAMSREDGEPAGELTNEVERRWLPIELDHEKDRGLLDLLQAKRLGEWMLAYLAVAWVASKLGDGLGEIWSWPVGLRKGIAMALALGSFPAAVIAWHHGEKGEQKVSRMELLIVGALVVGSAWLIWIVCA